MPIRCGDRGAPPGRHGCRHRGGERMARPLQQRLGDPGRRRRSASRAVLEEQGVHAEVTYPGPVLVGRAGQRHVPGRQQSRRPRGRVAGAARVQPMAGRLLFVGAPAAGPAASRSTSTTWTGRCTRSSGPASRDCSVASCCRPCRRRPVCAVTPTPTSTRSGARAKTTRWWSTCTPVRRVHRPTPGTSTTPSTVACSASTRCSCSPVGRCGS